MIRTIDTAVDEYRELGWPFEAEGTRVWLAAGEPYEAVTVPYWLGIRVHAALHGLGHVTPVLEAPGRLVFLTLPYRPCFDELRRPFKEIAVEHLMGGVRVYLPPTAHGPLTRRWVAPPVTPVTPFALVAAAVLGSASGYRVC